MSDTLDQFEAYLAFYDSKLVDKEYASAFWREKVTVEHVRGLIRVARAAEAWTYDHNDERDCRCGLCEALAALDAAEETERTR